MTKFYSVLASSCLVLASLAVRAQTPTPPQSQTVVQVYSPASLAGPIAPVAFPSIDNSWGIPSPQYQHLPPTQVACLTDSLLCDTAAAHSALAGKIALIYRGSCEFGCKALAAQRAGAVACFIINNTPSNTINAMAGGSCGQDVHIPVVLLPITTSAQYHALCGGVMGLASIGHIQGTVYYDLNGNCRRDSGERGIPNVRVATTGQLNYTITNWVGNYSLPLQDSGTNRIHVFLPPSLQIGNPSACPGDSFTVAGPVTDTTVINQDIGFSGGNCYRYDVSLDGRLRYCATNPFTLTRTNTSFGTGGSGLVYVYLPPPLVLVHASKPYQVYSPGWYFFQANSLPAFAHEDLYFDVQVPCVDSLRDDAFCILADMKPPGTCFTPPTGPTGWDGAQLTVHPYCGANGNGGFTIVNIGNAMANPSTYTTMMQWGGATTNSFSLGAGDSLQVPLYVVSVPAHITVHQTAHNPEAAYATSSWSPCVGGAALTPEFAASVMSDESPGQAQLCLPAVASYDPNDKTVSPAGYGPDHAVLRDVQLRYKIEFENSGTDTAFSVIVRDTLDQNLDATTLRVLQYSHNFNIKLTPQVNGSTELVFQSIGMKLPFKALDSVHCHGFVSFAIRAKAEASLGTVIRNQAGIYFDSNPVIMTPSVFVTLSNMDFPTATKPTLSKSSVSIFPNPAHHSVTVESTEPLQQVRILTLQGQVVCVLGGLNGTQALMPLQSLPCGMYQIEATDAKGRRNLQRLVVD